MPLLKPPFQLKPRHTLICMLMLATPLTAMGASDTTTPTKTINVKQKAAKKSAQPQKKQTPVDNSKAEMPEMIITEGYTDTNAFIPRAKEEYRLPTTTESVSSEIIEHNINAMTSEDTIKYLPSIQVRQRYIGDTNAPVGWRTSGTGMSARGLIYSDGIMLSSPLGNNNGNTGSPLWNMVAPSEIERVDVMYGPQVAAYTGNSIGGVVDIKTKMPTKFDVGGNVKATFQDFGFYGKNKTYDSQEYSGHVADKYKDLSFRFDASHLDSFSQPISYVDPTITSGTKITAGSAQALKGTNVTGAIANANPFGVAALVMGGSNLNHTLQDTYKWKLGYDITPSIHANYSLGLWTNDNKSKIDSYLVNPKTGATVASGLVNIGGYQYNLSPTGAPAFASTNVEQTHLFQGMRLHSDSGGVFDWDVNGSWVNFATDYSRVSTQTPAQSSLNGEGTNTSLTGTGWYTADAKGIWRPTAKLLGKHEVSFGFSEIGANLNQNQYNVKNWETSNTGSIKSVSQGKTSLEGYWAQDALDFNKAWNLTYGGRLEQWNAYDGYNATSNATSATRATSATAFSQTDRDLLRFSPKGKLTWKSTQRNETGFAIAKAYRFATVTELFNTTPATTSGGGTTVVQANPNLKPEEALSSELSHIYRFDDGKVRLSVFQEQIKDAIYSQTTLAPGSGSSTITTNSNVGEIQSYGLEFAADKSNVGIEGVDLFGTFTYVNSTITQNSATDAAIAASKPTAAQLAVNPYLKEPTTGKNQPKVPQWRAAGIVAYRPSAFNNKLNTSVNFRYTGTQYGQLNNADKNFASYTGGGTSNLIVDLHANYNITKQIMVAGGIDNVNDSQVWIFHPEAARTYFAEIKYNY